MENQIEEYLHNSLEFNEWSEGKLTLNDVTWLIDDYIKKHSKPIILDFLNWYMGDENSNLPNDMLEIVELYFKPKK